MIEYVTKIIGALGILVIAAGILSTQEKRQALLYISGGNFIGDL